MLSVGVCLVLLSTLSVCCLWVSVQYFYPRCLYVVCGCLFSTSIHTACVLYVGVCSVLLSTPPVCCLWASVQYFSPYLSADMRKMATAFNTSVADLEDEVMQLILDGQINARIDSHNKVRWVEAFAPSPAPVFYNTSIYIYIFIYIYSGCLLRQLHCDMFLGNLDEGAKTRVRVDYELLDEFEVNVGMHRGSVLSHFLFALVVDVVTEFAIEGALSELLYADDIVLRSETIKRHKDKFLKWEVPFEWMGWENQGNGQRRHNNGWLV